MSRKTVYIILVVVLMLVVGVVWFFVSRDATVPDDSDISTDTNDLFPFGDGGSRPSNGGGGTPSDGGSVVLDRTQGDTAQSLRKLSDDEVSGATLLTVASSTIARYMDRATGHIFDVDVKTGSKTRLSNTTMPQIYETMWSRGGNEFVARYLKEDGDIIQSFYGRLSTSTPLRGYFLPANIKELAVVGNEIVYIDPSIDGALAKSRIDGTGASFVTNLYSQDWLISTGGSTVVIGSKPSGMVPGTIYALDMLSGVKKSLIQDVLGLTGIPNNDGSYVFASAYDRGSLISAIHTTKSGTTTPLSLSTLSEKCVWGRKNTSQVYCAVPVATPRAIYPDDWYQGLVSLEDRFWVINAPSGNADFLSDPSLVIDQSFDAIHLVTDQNDEHLIFINKNDSSLWVLDLK